MLNIIKADLYRIIKDKLFIVLLIICAVMALIFPLFYGIILRAVDTEVVNPFGLTISALQPFSNFGLICSIFVMIILNRDYSTGTIRNKVIIGKSRLEIFLSELVIALILILGIMLTYAMLTFVFSCLTMFSTLKIDDLGIFFASLGLQLLGWVALTCIMVFFTKALKGIGGAIALYIAIGLVLTTVGSFSSLINAVSGQTGEYINQVLRNLNIFYVMGSYIPGQISPLYALLSSGGLAADVGYGYEFLLEYILSASLFGFGAAALAFVIFNKRDLK